MRPCKITTLVENTVTALHPPVLGEHGLAFFIETGDRKILFDTGQGLTLLANADALGIDLTTVDTVALSHAHYDHAGGIKKLLTRNNKINLIAHPALFDNKLVSWGGSYYPVGIPQDKELIENSHINIKFEKNAVEIAPGVMLTGEIPMQTSFEDVEALFYTGESGNYSRDMLLDDRALILDTEKGTVVVLGCAHRGVVNTLNHVVQLTG
ncbi:MAG: MBL fold metallo-hydrolase, partial [Desulfobacterales bacterium]|nr:MBL fold metallo-hydrolase [Desulfobacterales bacterium]